MQLAFDASVLGSCGVKFALHLANVYLLLLVLVLLLLEFELAHFMFGLDFFGLFHEIILHFLVFFELSLIYDQDVVLILKTLIHLSQFIVLLAQLFDVDLLQLVDLELDLCAACLIIEVCVFLNLLF